MVVEAVDVDGVGGGSEGFCYVLLPCVSTFQLETA